MYIEGKNASLIFQDFRDSNQKLSMQDMDSIILDLRDQLAKAKESGETIRIRGGGSKDFYGLSKQGKTLETTALSGIIEYEPTELVLTAYAGTPLSEIEAALAQNNQMLPFEPPYFGENATFGGCIATGLSGPRRATMGAVRDFVLGVRILDGNGKDLSFGGKVMKNVAGFDVSRVLTGSNGTLGLILSASVKVLPKPEVEKSVCFVTSEKEAIVKMNEIAGLPVPLSGSCFDGEKLVIRLSGAGAAVRAGIERIGGDGFNDQNFWDEVKEQRHPFFRKTGTLIRLSINSASPPIENEQTFLEWNGSLRWLWGSRDLDHYQEIAKARGGNASIFRSDTTCTEIMKLSRPMMRLQEKVKQSLDPHGLFGKNRMFKEF